MVLEKKDAGDWIYRGEGAANIVLSCNGSSPAFVGKVLRIQKAPRNGSPRCESPRYGSDNEDNHSAELALTTDECLLWKEIEDLGSAPSREIAEQLYVQHIITPLLGSEHVDAGIRVHVSSEFLELVEKNVLASALLGELMQPRSTPFVIMPFLYLIIQFFPRVILKGNSASLLR